ncbi:nuclear transport factor 2 family protein [Nocardia sp. NPDC052566]|uniref:nuclear transport factor 2 family protein n=1 Tax=Nocardia sp. NPDC052566 TaxID=3364330 RepID=UPI0037C515C0
MSTDHTRELFQQHLKFWKAGDLDGLMRDFHPDAYMISARGVIKGLDNIRQLYAQVFEHELTDDLRAGISFDKQKYEGDVAFSEWSGPGIVYAADTMVVKDGLKWVETFAGVYENN